nr:hypothetical protein [Tanacetum cinerariifolium]
PKYSPSMGYEHPNTTPKTESDKIIKSGVEELVPILSENEVTSEDKKECDMPEEVDLEDISQIQYVVLREKLLSINRLISNIKSLNDNPTPDRVLNFSVSIPISEESDNSLSDNFLPEFETFCDHTEETRSDTTTHADKSLPEYDSFCFEIESDQERLINVVMNDISDDSSNDSLLEEADLFLASDNSILPGIENFAYDSKGDIRFLVALLIDDSIPFPLNESSESNNPSFPRPPPEPPDVEFNFELDSGEEISVVMNDNDKLECLDPRDEFDEITFLSCLSSEFFCRILSIPRCFLYFSPQRVKTPSLTLVSPFRAGGFTPHRLKFLVFDFIIPVRKSFTSFL